MDSSQLGCGFYLTGGHGFIGSRVTRKVIERGHTARCLVREKSKVHRIADLPFERAAGDVRDVASLVEGMKGTDACIHLASVSAWRDMKTNLLEATIIDGTRNVLAAAEQAGVARVVFVSSVLAVNGSKAPMVFDEASPFMLEGSGLRYAIAKRKAEGLVAEAVARGLDVVTVNPAEVYGPGDDDFITAGNLRDILSSWPAMACHGGNPVCHVDDIADGILAALDRGRRGERYILGGENLTVEQTVRLTLEVAGKKTPVLLLPNGLVKGLVKLLATLHLPTPAEPEVLEYATLHWFMDSGKAERELGYRPRPARATIESVVRWLHEAGHVKGKLAPRDATATAS